MNKFKVGDLVSPIKTSAISGYDKNKVYKVLATKLADNGEPLITILTDDSRIRGFYEFKFELADKPLPDWF